MDGVLSPSTSGRPLGAPTLRDFEFGVADPISHAISRHSAAGRWATAADRLADPSQATIPAAGHFTDEAAMETAWTLALAGAAPQIDAWRRGRDRRWPYDAAHPFIAEVDLQRTVGGTLTRDEFDRGQRTENPARSVRIVLTPSARFACGFEPVTAYAVLEPRPQARIAPTTLDAQERLAGQPLVTTLPTGHPVTTRLLDRGVVDRALRELIRRWSGDIEAWRRDPAATWPLRLTACFRQPVGTVSVDGGSEFATPLLTATLEKSDDARARSGWRVTTLQPSRGW